MSALLWALLAGCLQPANTGGDCASCHGDAETAAPPAALGGQTSTDFVGVGAHRAHWGGERLGTPVACAECHAVPEAVGDEGHVDSLWPAEVRWGDLGRTGGLVGTWDRDAQTCSNIYCHGASLPGALDPVPVWNVVDGSQVACAGCHGMPPDPPHAADPACATCHAQTAGPDWTINDPTTHIDGQVQIGDDPTVSEPTGCTGCHGSSESSSPPPDTSGSSDTTRRSVGAHAAHNLGGAVSRGVACDGCHLVPATVDAEGHLGDAPAEVTFSGVAVADGARPTWNTNTLTCSDSYCHGSAEPSWVDVGTGEAACGSCHGRPPPPPHPASSNCSGCHSSGGTSDPARHVDGNLDF